MRWRRPSISGWSGVPAKRGRIDREKLAAAQAYFDALPRMNEHLTDDEVIGYNEWGTFGS